MASAPATRSPLFVILFTVFVDLIGFGVVIPLLPFYASAVGGGPLVLGLLIAAFFGMQFLLAPVLGSVSDRLGRRPVLLATLVVATAGHLLLAAANSLVLLFAARVLAGMAAGNLSVAQAYIADRTRPEQRAKGMGLIGAAFGVGFAVGPVIGGTLVGYGLFALSVFATFLWYMAAPTSHRKGALTNIGVTILGVAYIPLLAGYALAMLKLEDGRGLVLAVIGLTFVYDTAAFVVGSWWGNRPLAPTISPKKSMEGAVGATLVTIAVSVGAVSPQETLEVLNTVSRSVGLAVVVALFAPLGDLAESLLKRDLGIKDMGSVLPGHGGVLDRIDSVLFVAPAAFMFLRLILL